MRMNKVRLELGNGVRQFDNRDGVTVITLQDGKTVEADLVILSIGVKPNSQLAKDCGLELNAREALLSMNISRPQILIFTRWATSSR